MDAAIIRTYTNVMFPTGSLESLSRPIPAPPLIAEAHATLFGDRDRILELDEASLRMRHRGLDGDDHDGHTISSSSMKIRLGCLERASRKTVANSGRSVARIDEICSSKNGVCNLVQSIEKRYSHPRNPALTPIE